MSFHLKNTSIKKLTLFIFIIIYILFFIITSINIYSFSSYEFKRTEKIIENNTQNVSGQIEQKLNTCIDISKYPLIIPETDKLTSILSNNKPYTITELNFISYICQMILIQNDLINGVYIYNLSGNGISASRNISNDKLKNLSTEDWFINAKNSEKAVKIIPNMTFNNIYENSTENDDSLIAVTRQITNLQTQELSGILLLTIPSYEIEKLLLNNLPYNNEILQVYDNNNNLIISTNTFDNNKNSSDLTDSLKQIENNSIIKTDANIICKYKIDDLEWSVINYIPKTSINKTSKFYLNFFVYNLIFYLILFLIIYIFFLNRIFTPISCLIENMNKRTDFNLSSEFKYTKNDEIGILVKSYNDMKNRIHRLIDLNYKTKLDQKELELQQLQNQINPHFIYNTLESIHMMAEINDHYETSIMAEYFGSIIRYSMNKKVNTVTLKEEIKIINNYIYLQKVRFDSLFTIDNLISSDVADCQIIKMIIQPLIENSIYHGLSQCSSNGKIIIQAMHVENNLIITVSDNGKGISDEKLHLLNEYINDKNNEFKGIALKNINKRLKLNYGNEYGLEIFSVLNNGTSMVLTLPYIL